MSDAEGAQDDIQVGAVEVVGDPSDISWHTTAWSAGAEAVTSTKVASRIGESCKQPASALSGKTVTFDLQGAEIGENGDGDGTDGGGVVGGGGNCRGCHTDTSGKQEIDESTNEQSTDCESKGEPKFKRVLHKTTWLQKTQETYTKTAWQTLTTVRVVDFFVTLLYIHNPF